MKNKLVCGVGINDANYFVSRRIKEGGKWKIVWWCPAYSAWKSMLSRAFNAKYKQEHPSYADVKVCDEWLKFSQFKLWWDQQNKPDGLKLDKDLLVKGNKVYCPQNCALVPCQINNLFLDRANNRGNCPLGVYFDSVSQKYCALVGAGFGKKQKYLGRFTSAEQAHQAWQKAKIDLINEVILWYKHQPYFSEKVEIALKSRVDQLESDLEIGRQTFKL